MREEQGYAEQSGKGEVHIWQASKEDLEFPAVQKEGRDKDVKPVLLCVC